MKVLFISSMPKRGVSGGRYLAALSAESLARKGADVTYLVDRINHQVFDQSIIKNIKLSGCLTFLFGRIAFLDNIIVSLVTLMWKKKFDICVVIPELGGTKLKSLIDLSFNVADKVYLYNFETPNWFNTYSPVKKDPELWKSWKYAVDQGAGVICISKESAYWGSQYYKTANHLFSFNCPVYQLSDIQNSIGAKTNSALCITRFDSHKGMEGLCEIIKHTDGLDEFILMLGSVAPPKALLDDLNSVCIDQGVNLKIKKAVSHSEKYQILQRTKVLIFPTFFEGLGMPPIEALASGLSVIAFELPVLREISQKIRFVSPGDYAAMGREISETLMQNEGGDKNITRYSVENCDLYDHLFNV